MTAKDLKTILEKHQKWLRGEENGELADLSGANLSRANLSGADLRWANLREADLDYSCFPLWCGGSRFTVDDRLLYQLLAHLCSLDIDTEDGKKVRELILPYAKKSHRAKELGITAGGDCPLPDDESGGAKK